MFTFDFQVAPDIIPQWQKSIENWPVELAQVIEVSGGIVDDAQRELDAVNVYPPSVVYPIEWTSPAQKGYYFAVVAEYDAQGNVIPYQRRGTMFDEAKIEFDATLLTLRITDPNPIRRYVTDADQQKFHANTGWFNSEGPYTRIIIRAQQGIIDAWFDIVDWKNLA